MAISTIQDRGQSQDEIFKSNDEMIARTDNSPNNRALERVAGRTSWVFRHTVIYNTVTQAMHRAIFAYDPAAYCLTFNGKQFMAIFNSLLQAPWKKKALPLAENAKQCGKENL